MRLKQEQMTEILRSHDRFWFCRMQMHASADDDKEGADWEDLISSGIYDLHYSIETTYLAKDSQDKALLADPVVLPNIANNYNHQTYFVREPTKNGY